MKKTADQYIVIGITGGVGTGKSAVLSILGQLGAALLDADQIYHDLIKPRRAGWRAVVKSFGRNILDHRGSVDRHKLGALVYGHPDLRRRLERVTHPLIRKETDRRIRELHRRGRHIVAVEIPLLVEAKAFRHVDTVWLVMAPQAVQISRLKRKWPHLSFRRLKEIIASQLPLSEKRKYADVLIRNGTSRYVTQRQVYRAWKKEGYG